MDQDAVQDIEIQILLDVLLKRYGYDFHNYADASLKRRIQRCLTVCKFKYVSEIIPKLLYEGTRSPPYLRRKNL
jgi:chemotaxis protein methyltransferase CheR